MIAQPDSKPAGKDRRNEKRHQESILYRPNNIKQAVESKRQVKSNKSQQTGIEAINRYNVYNKIAYPVADPSFGYL